ncbi:sensor histidine kinase [Phenylobacterium zucineum HLK1]|uniref:histidine kinase n=1 Tax=Phenylobacterium zucineum (strain HLK1) TaxID=450851 RepID=B4RFN0_PHEZH|nr:response regulator [Phenylobacterium zucineum]ACG77111.1 sensor histidine kinase [Phenylobacterium zucineum HLK1]
MTAQRARLMMVDDEADILVALQDLFETTYDVSAFTSPAEALEALAGGLDPAVIVSDQRMPGMPGDRFLAEARRLCDAGAILLTGYADLSAVTAALNGGGIVGYVPKPWEPDALKAMVAGAVEQHHLRRALGQEQALLHGLMDHLPYAVAFKDAQGRFVHLNERKAGEFGRAAAACVGLTEAELGGVVRAEERQAIAERRALQVVEERPGPAGPSWIQVEYVPLLGRAGEVETLVVMERDITEQRLAEQQLRQSDKLRALGTLAGGVAHDFNNLLTAIVGSLELASKRLDRDPETVRRYLDNAALAAQRGASLTQRLLGFSRRTDSRLAVVDVAAAMTGMRDLLSRTLGGGVEVEWRIAADLWPTSVEPDQLEVAILNLAINARDAMPDGGVITIAARNVSLPAEADLERGLTAGDYVMLVIADTGEGMPPELLERVLEPFFTTKPVGKGTGLGLPMVYGFAQRSGGTLSIRSTPGQGTEVVMYLPRAGEADEPLPESAPAAVRRGPRARILVLDDEPGVRSVTAASLRDLGHEVVEAADGPAALAILQGGREVDLAVVDFAMPGMNGLEFVEKARRLAAGLPVILLTGYVDVEAAPDDVMVLHKPFTAATLEAAVAAALATEFASREGLTL